MDYLIYFQEDETYAGLHDIEDQYEELKNAYMILLQFL